MARWENEDVSGLNLPERTQTLIHYYGKGGTLCEEKLSFAKTVVTQSNGLESVKHYVRFTRGELVDPHSVDYNLKTQLATFKKVNEKSFNQYIKYLETKNRLYFTRSRRLSQEN